MARRERNLEERRARLARLQEGLERKRSRAHRRRRLALGGLALVAGLVLAGLVGLQFLDRLPYGSRILEVGWERLARIRSNYPSLDPVWTALGWVLPQEGSGPLAHQPRFAADAPLLDPPVPNLTARAGTARYPDYFPVGGLLAPPLRYFISCENSNRAGELRTLADRPVDPPSRGLLRGMEFVYEPCLYDGIAPARVPRGQWADGAQVIHRSALAGDPARFRLERGGSLRINPGRVGVNKFDVGRFHAEVSDIEVDVPNSADSGALWFEVFPSATDDVLTTLVVRDSSFSGARNAFFVPPGATMLYIERSRFGPNGGSDYDQEHTIYLNGIVSAHFVDSVIFGQQAKGSIGGHLLKARPALTILENVAFDTGGSPTTPSNRPMADLPTLGWIWAEDLAFRRRQPDSPTTRNAVIGLRRDRYVGGRGARGRVQVPWPTAADWEMPMAPGECDEDVSEDVYLQVFRGVRIESHRMEPFGIRQSGFVDTEFNGLKPVTSKEELLGHPRRNRALTLYGSVTGDIRAPAAAQGYFGSTWGPPSYVCPISDVTNLNMIRVVRSQDAFVETALRKISLANGDLIRRAEIKR
ncbi:hypothetical protein B5C34_02425 [Pacificimonas flava]|uniref:Uncharacterized protein n=2 Tax=Pacificimonas TaxID=1960290 RepID=A0A219B3N5_9SPHN|nr:MULTISPECIES: hypothetical protein [Pacificimonas]MBZ6377924.1 hypothetical protein [Pacificimonas aurantium]OWV32418.1 hypothetical protein B5C34_02425 [Pacificimonas flava]